MLNLVGKKKIIPFVVKVTVTQQFETIKERISVITVNDAGNVKLITEYDECEKERKRGHVRQQFNVNIADVQTSKYQ